MEDCLQLLVPTGECETVLRRQRDSTKLLQLGAVGEGGSQVDDTEAWQVVSRVEVGLFLVGAAFSSRSLLRPGELQHNFPRVRGFYLPGKLSSSELTSGSS